MPRDDEYLLDMLEAAKLALAYVHGKTKEQFTADVQVQDSVIRRLEVIGEAARRVSHGTRARFPSLEWAAMISMRNFMIHEYDDVDVGVVWSTVRDNLPELVRVLSNAVPPDTG